MQHQRPKTLGQFTEMQYILMGDLRELLETPVSKFQRNWLLTILDALLETLPQQFRIKEEGGYMTEVVEAVPYWDAEVEKLRGEHGPLCETLRDLRTRVAEGSQFKEVAEIVRLDLQRWVERMTAHDHHESQLFQNSVNLEIGVGD